MKESIEEPADDVVNTKEGVIAVLELAWPKDRGGRMVRLGANIE